VYNPQRCTPSWRRPSTGGHLGTSILWTARVREGRRHNNPNWGCDCSFGRRRKMAAVWRGFQRRCDGHLRRHCWRSRACTHGSDGATVAGPTLSRWARRLLLLLPLLPAIRPLCRGRLGQDDRHVHCPDPGRCSVDKKISDRITSASEEELRPLWAEHHGVCTSWTVLVASKIAKDPNELSFADEGKGQRE
jgi:hypothetical protein